MSLRVWLPLNKDWRNNGTYTGNNWYAMGGVSYNIDGYHTFDGSTPTSYGITNSTTYSSTVSSDLFTKYLNNHSFSVSIWAKTASGFDCNTNNGGALLTLGYGVSLRYGASGVPLVWLTGSDGNGGTVDNGTWATTNCNDLNWHHLAFTYNVSDNAIKIYVDGVCEKTAYYPSGYSFVGKWTNNIAIGRDVNSNTKNDRYFFRGALYDFRIYDHALSAKEVKELSKGLYLHYTFANPYVGSITAYSDESGFGNDGTITGTLQSIDWSARYSSSTKFNSAAIRMKDPLMSSINEYTIAGWVYPTSSSYMTLWNGRTTAGAATAVFYTSENKIRFDDGGTQTHSTTTLPLNTWSHFACTYKTGGQKCIYINGSLTNNVSASTSSRSKSNTYATIGLGSSADSTPSGNPIVGNISDFRIYKKQLASSDILDLYKTGAAVDNTLNLHCFEVIENVEDLYNLIYNGKMLNGMNGYLNSINSTPNTFTCDTSDKPSGCSGSYSINLNGSNPWNSGTRKGCGLIIPYINSDTYKFSFLVKDNGTTDSTTYMCLLPFDNKVLFIWPEEISFYEPGGSTKTTLAQDLKNGDTVVYLTSATNWTATTTYRVLGIIESIAYKDDRALTWLYISQNGVDTTNNTVTLSSAWSKGTYKAGSQVREFSSGGTYYYPMTWSNKPSTWTLKEKTFSKSSDLRLPWAYFLGWGPMYGKLKLADLRFENTSKKLIRFPNSTENIPIVPSASYGSIDSYLELNADITKSGILNSGTISEGFLPVRYIRDWINGSTANSGNHWCEIQAFDRDGRNVAFAANGSLPTTGYINVNGTGTSRGGLNQTNTTTFKPLHVITQNTINTNYIAADAGLKSITIDMGTIHWINCVKVWHYYNGDRTYHNTKTEVSADGTNWITIFDSASEGEYLETSSGHTIMISNAQTKIKKGGDVFTNTIIED